MFDADQQISMLTEKKKNILKVYTSSYQTYLTLLG